MTRPRRTCARCSNSQDSNKSTLHSLRPQHHTSFYTYPLWLSHVYTCYITTYFYRIQRRLPKRNKTEKDLEHSRRRHWIVFTLYLMGLMITHFRVLIFFLLTGWEKPFKKSDWGLLHCIAAAGILGAILLYQTCMRDIWSLESSCHMKGKAKASYLRHIGKLYGFVSDLYLHQIT